MMKVAIFDFDGTLANTFPWFLSRINLAAEALRFNKIKEEDVPRLRSMSVSEILKFLEIPFWKVPLIMFYMRRLMAQDTESICLFEEVPSFLKRLQEKNIKVMILSSNSETNVKRILQDSTRYVTEYCCGAGLRSKAKHLRVVKRKYPHAEFISVGDELRDYEAAKEEGITHLNVSWGYASREVFKELEVVDTISDLELRILRQFDIKD